MNIYFYLSRRNFSRKKKKPVPYQISENKSTNHKAYNYMVTTTTTSVMKYMIVSKDPTQNNTVLFTWKTVKDYGKATLEIEYFVLDGEKVIAYKILSVFNDLYFCEVTEMTDILLTFTATPRFSNTSLENRG